MNRIGKLLTARMKEKGLSLKQILSLLSEPVGNYSNRLRKLRDYFDGTRDNVHQRSEVLALLGVSLAELEAARKADADEAWANRKIETFPYPHLWLKGSLCIPSMSITIYAWCGGDKAWKMIKYPRDFPADRSRAEIVAQGHEQFAIYLAATPRSFPFGEILGYWVVLSETEHILFNTDGTLAENQSGRPHHATCWVSVR